MDNKEYKELKKKIVEKKKMKKKGDFSMIVNDEETK